VGVARSSTGERGSSFSVGVRPGINALREDPLARCGPSGGKATALRLLDGKETASCDEALAMGLPAVEEFCTSSAFSGEVGESTVTKGRKLDPRKAGPGLCDIALL